VIVDLPDTTTSAISKTLVKIRDEGGAVALGRVLTLVISVELGEEEEAIEAANDASREHPMRILVVSTENERRRRDDPPRLDAEIRVGGDAGASEVIVLKAYGDAADQPESLITGLLLPDAPVVAWWPQHRPDAPSMSAVGRIAQRRIIDSSSASNPRDALERLRASYAPGDTDFAWTRLTLWRALLAAVLDQPPFETVTSVTVNGAADSPSTTLLAAWLQLELGVPVALEVTAGSGASGIHGVTMHRASGPIRLERELPAIATLEQPGQPTHDVSLPRRSLRDCLTEELRHLDPDELFGKVLVEGMGQLAEPTHTRPIRVVAQ
jgi:glucose-6-phosphate dehydrogenase assembly protein OpcA